MLSFDSTKMRNISTKSAWLSVVAKKPFKISGWQPTWPRSEGSWLGSPNFSTFTTTWSLWKGQMKLLPICQREPCRRWAPQNPRFRGQTPCHMRSAPGLLPDSIMAGKAVGALKESLNSFKLGGNFLSFSRVNALDKLMQSNPDSFTRQSSTSGPPRPTVHLLSPIILTKLIAACACCDNNNGTAI